MPYALVRLGGDNPPYSKAIIEFLESLETKGVNSLACVALCDDGEVMTWYNASAGDLKMLSGMLDFAATRELMYDEMEEDN